MVELDVNKLTYLLSLSVERFYFLWKNVEIFHIFRSQTTIFH